MRSGLVKWVQLERTTDLIWLEILIRLFNGWDERRGREVKEGASNEKKTKRNNFELNEILDVGKKKGTEGRQKKEHPYKQRRGKKLT